MPAATVIAPRAGEVIGDAPDRRVEILCDHAALNATWSRFAAGRAGADLHVHRRHSDLFYVLEGELTVRLGLEDRQVAVPAGTLARVPPNVVHGFRNASDAEVRYLNLHAPGCRFADYLRGLRDGRAFSYDQYDPPADGGRSPEEAVVGGDPAVLERPGARVRVLADLDEIAVAEVACEPGAAAPELDGAGGPALRWLYVLEGEVAIAAGDRELRAPAGAWVDLPPEPGDGAAAAAGGPARLLAVRAPFGGA